MNSYLPSENYLREGKRHESTMHPIGRVVRLQIQPVPLKYGHPQRYHPDRLLEVNRICLSNKGVLGEIRKDEWIMDIHHVEHPQSHARRGNALSLCFTSHYTLLRTHFGNHMIDGCAGENILIETETCYSQQDLGTSLAIQNTATGSLLYLTDPTAILPCAPFSRFALRAWLPPSKDLLRETLQYLGQGRRGFYLQLSQIQTSPIIQEGDYLFRL